MKVKEYNLEVSMKSFAELGVTVLADDFEKEKGNIAKFMYNAFHIIPDRREALEFDNLDWEQDKSYVDIESFGMDKYSKEYEVPDDEVESFLYETARHNGRIVLIVSDNPRAKETYVWRDGFVVLTMPRQMTDEEKRQMELPGV